MFSPCGANSKVSFIFIISFLLFFCFFTKKHELHVKWHEKGLLSKSLINLFRIETNKKLTNSNRKGE